MMISRRLLHLVAVATALLGMIQLAWLIDLTWHPLSTPYSDLPPDYLFLTFPSSECAQLVRSEERCPQRAVLVTKRELDGGTVEYFEGGDRIIRAKLLTFVPAGGAENYLAAWRKTLRDYEFSRGDWETRNVGNGVTEVTLDLDESTNDRREKCVYVVRNNVVLSGTITLMNPFSVLGKFLAILIIVVVAILGWRFIRRLPASPRRGSTTE